MDAPLSLVGKGGETARRRPDAPQRHPTLGAPLAWPQLAKAMGASLVVGTSSAPKHPLLKELGCDETIDYKTQDFTQVRRQRCLPACGPAGHAALARCLGCRGGRRARSKGRRAASLLLNLYTHHVWRKALCTAQDMAHTHATWSPCPSADCLQVYKDRPFDIGLDMTGEVRPQHTATYAHKVQLLPT